MELLRDLTLLYAAVLVVALAASLITIFVFLWRIGSVLGEVRTALESTEQRTQPLTRHLQPLALLQAEEIDSLERAGAALRESEQLFGEAATRRGVDAA